MSNYWVLRLRGVFDAYWRQGHGWGARDRATHFTHDDAEACVSVATWGNDRPIMVRVRCRTPRRGEVWRWVRPRWVSSLDGFVVITSTPMTGDGTMARGIHVADDQVWAVERPEWERGEWVRVAKVGEAWPAPARQGAPR